MAQVDHKSCCQFLKSLNVPDVIKKKREAKVHSRKYVQKPKSEPPQDGDAEGYVNAGALVSFVDLTTAHIDNSIRTSIFRQALASNILSTERTLTSFCMHVSTMEL